MHETYFFNLNFWNAFKHLLNKMWNCPSSNPLMYLQLYSWPFVWVCLSVYEQCTRWEWSFIIQLLLDYLLDVYLLVLWLSLIKLFCAKWINVWMWGRIRWWQRNICEFAQNNGKKELNFHCCYNKVSSSSWAMTCMGRR